jgi:hypothetical protein
MGQQPLIAPPDRPGDRSTEIAALPTLRTSWSAVGRTLITDGQGNQVVSPARDIGPMFDAEAWERLAPVLAAAPELLALLHEIDAGWLEKVPGGPPADDYPRWHKLRALIAKATGG